MNKNNPTHALTENWIVCRSQRKGVGLASALADVPEVLAVDPASFQAMHYRNEIGYFTKYIPKNLELDV